MFDNVRRLFGAISLVIAEDKITVRGVPADVMSRDIKKLWASNRVNAFMFTHLDKNSFTFPAFFAPDIVYMLDQLTEVPRLGVARKTLSKIKDILLTESWLAKTQVLPPSKLNRAKLSELIYDPLDFQDEFFTHYDIDTQQYGLNGYLFAGAAGSGKTYSSLALTNCLDVDLVVVVCPKPALNTVWETSVKELFKTPQTYWISSNDKELVGTERFIIGHYESLERVAELVARFKGRRIAVILDESHYLNTATSLRTNRFIDMCRDIDSKNIVWLSGTPIKAMSSESIPLLRCIDPLFTPDVEYRFKKIFKDSNDKAVAILNNRIGIISFKVEKKRLDLQPPIMKEIKVKIPNGAEYTLRAIKEKMTAFISERHNYYGSRKEDDERFYAECLATFAKTLRSRADELEFNQYKAAVKLIIANRAREVPDEMMFCNRFEKTKIIPTLSPDAAKQFKETKSIIKYLHLKIQGECLGRIVGGSRMQVHVDMIPYIPFADVCETTEKKTVVFTAFVNVVEDLMKSLPEQGLKPVSVYGKTNVNLSATVSNFAKNEEINPLVATYASLSTAVPLTMADTMILVDSPFRDYILQQTISRIHRLGATTQTYVYTVTLDTGDEVNISTRSTDILKWSQKQVEDIMGIKSPFVFTDEMEEFSTALEEHMDGPQDVLALEEIAPEKKVPAYLSW